MKKLLIGIALLVSSTALQVWAEDIDLFTGVAAQESGKPNIVFMVDNTSNWNDAFPIEKEALSAVFYNMDPNAFSIGFAMYGESPTMGYIRAAIREMSDTRTDSDGVTKTYAELYGDMIDSFTKNGQTTDSANNRAQGGAFAEIYRYIKGLSSIDTTNNTGLGKNDKRDWSNNDVNKVTPATQVIYGLPGNALSNDRDTVYNKPEDPGVCADTYVIYIGNNNPGGNVTTESGKSLTEARSALIEDGGVDALSPPVSYRYVYDDGTYQDSWSDEYARFMHEKHGVVFYALDITPTEHPDYDFDENGVGIQGQGRGMGSSELLRALSEGVGGGEYIRVDDPNDIAVVLNNVLAKIQAENSVFAAVALPASAAGNSIFLNQVFVGLFRPDELAKPKWPGNLKQYKLKLFGNELRLTDARNERAINGNTGFVDDCARSFWTPAAEDTYWTFDPRGTCGLTTGDPAVSNSPDGPYVEKGAQSYRLIQDGYAARNIETCAAGYTSGSPNCSALQAFTTANVSNADLNADDDAERDSILAWAIGKDVFNINGDEISAGNGNYADTRAYVHGDVIHSRPVAINYAADPTTDDPKIVVFYGGNDGMLRAVNGNQTEDLVLGPTGSTTTYPPGDELWAFMPPEFLGDIKRLYVNTDVVKTPATGPGAAGRPGSPKDYGMDGPMTVWKDPGTSERYLYVGMRRGGRALYAFNITDPRNPVLLWKKGCQGADCDNDTVGTPAQGWTDIGQTWSSAEVAYIQDRANPVLIMGGGYDVCEDEDTGSGGKNHACTVSTTGTFTTINQTSETGETGDHIYVIDPLNGDLLAVFDTERAVPGSVTLVPAFDPSIAVPNPPISFAYAADAGGNIYRLSGPLDVNFKPTAIGNATDPATWVLSKIASFGCGDQATSSCGAGPNRKFLFGPDVVRDNITAGLYRVLGGTGDREKPLKAYTSTTTVQNYFYSFMDTPLNPWTDTGSDCGADVICRDVLFEVTTITEDGEAFDLDAYEGFSVKLADDEQVVTSSLVVGDIANFSTHIPFDPNEVAASGGDVCKNALGTATTYNIGFEDAAGVTNDIKTGGLVPSPVAGMVEICENGVCTYPPFCIGCGGENSPIGGGNAYGASPIKQSKGRVFYRIEQ